MIKSQGDPLPSSQVGYRHREGAGCVRMHGARRGTAQDRDFDVSNGKFSGGIRIAGHDCTTNGIRYATYKQRQQSDSQRAESARRIDYSHLTIHRSIPRHISKAEIVLSVIFVTRAPTDPILT